MTELDRIAPRIDIRADQLKVLKGPEEFYDALKRKIRGARKRIYLSTLYIGRSENELASTIRDALLHNGPDLKVSILTDALRGTRESPGPSCASLLAELAAEFPERVEIRMYHTPNLTGLRRRLIPKRINEGWGLQHIKLYGFDDEVIISGANLSTDYFTNRQDRYHIFSSKRVTDYFARIHHAVCSVSFLLRPSANEECYTLSWPTSNPAPSPLTNPREHTKAATSLLLPLVSPPGNPPPIPSAPLTTSVYPIVSHPPTLNTELPALRALFSSPVASYTFTAGYFNPHPLITSSIIACSSPPKSTSATILTAHPLANGFYNSSGISGLLPAAYTHLSLRFLQASRGANIQLREWQRGSVGQPGGWTYHAKGLWINLLGYPVPSAPSSTTPTSTEKNTSTEVSQSGPAITVIGSSNYTTRSYRLDLEAGAIVVTRDTTLMQQWREEQEALLARSKPVSEEELGAKGRKAGWRVRLAMWIVSIVGGAL
jgi:CDP-diacylglycerol---glycerol-3-phosphate 3-phosphatidyltransferase